MIQLKFSNDMVTLQVIHKTKEHTKSHYLVLRQGTGCVKANKPDCGSVLH